jgi:aspartokinase
LKQRRSRSAFFTDPISCDVAEAPRVASLETEFEKRRGISRVEIEVGFAQVSVLELSEPVMDARLQVLERMDDLDISIDFLKFSPSGLSFLVREDAVPKLSSVAIGTGARLEVHEGQGLVLVHAVNMRDEEGLVAKILSVAIASGVPVDHVGDMHDRLLIVTSEAGAETIAAVIEDELVGTSL